MKVKDLPNNSIGLPSNLLLPAAVGKVISFKFRKNKPSKEFFTKAPILLNFRPYDVIFEKQIRRIAKLYPGYFSKIDTYTNGLVAAVPDNHHP